MQNTRGGGVYLVEGYCVLPTLKSAKSREIFRKLEPKWQNGYITNNPVGKKGKYSQSKYLRKCLYVNTLGI